MADDELNVAAALATLRGSMETGFERLDGKLNLIAQAQQSVSKDVEGVAARVTAVEGRVAALEERRWPLGVLAVVAGVVAAVAAVGAWLLAT